MTPTKVSQREEEEVEGGRTAGRREPTGWGRRGRDHGLMA